MLASECCSLLVIMDVSDYHAGFTFRAIEGQLSISLKSDVHRDLVNDLMGELAYPDLNVAT